MLVITYSKIFVKRPLSKIPKIGFQEQLSLNTSQKYCRMLQGEHSAILSTFIKQPIVIKIFVLSILRVAVLHRFNCKRAITYKKSGLIFSSEPCLLLYFMYAEVNA